MADFIEKPRTFQGEQYTPGQPCTGVFPQPDGSAVTITRSGPQSVNPGDIICPERDSSGYFFSRPLTEIEAPEQQAMKSQMIALWDGLPVEVRAAFRPLKTAVLDAINDNYLDEVHLLISSAVVPAKYTAVKDGLLALLA